MAILEDVRRAKQVLSARLLKTGLRRRVAPLRFARRVANAVASAVANVHAVGVGRKITNGKPTKDLCVRIYVTQKLPRSLLPPRDLIPDLIDGIATDIIQSPVASALARRKSSRRRASAAAASCSSNRLSRQRPVIAGISAAHHDVTAGTVRFFCRSVRHGDDPNRVCVVSNNHVFADLNAGHPGDPLCQPGPLDGGTLDDVFAELDRFIPIELGIGGTNQVDAALGIVLPEVEHLPEICTIGTIAGTTRADEEMPVRKHGRTTGPSEGVVSDASYDALVEMDEFDPDVLALFENQIRIESTAAEAFALGGDSGSAIVHKTRRELVGLYFAGPDDGSYGVANHIDDVLTKLEVELL